MEDFNIDDIFSDVTSSTSLGEGVHENVKLVSIDISKRKDRNNKPIKMQTWLKFKKYSKTGEDIGEKEISFFMLDPTKESVINNTILYMQQLQSIMQIFITEEEMDSRFDPLREVIDPDNDKEIEDKDLDSEVIKGTFLTKTAQFKLLEEAIKTQFNEVMKDHIGVNSSSFRLKLEESRDGKYIQIPMFADFIEKLDVKKDSSTLYN